MKKIVLLLLALMLVFALAACDTTDTPEPAPTPEIPVALPEPPPEEIEEPDEEPTDDVASGHTGGVALGLTIERLDVERVTGPIGDASFMHKFDFREHMYVPDMLVNPMMIRTFTTLHNFSVIVFMENDVDENGEIFFIPIGTYGTIDTFEPHEAFIIDSFVSAGTVPHTGITFVDDTGQSWFFAIIQNQADELVDPYLLIQLEYRDGVLRYLSW